MKKIKIIRATTVPESLDSFCNGFLKVLNKEYEVIALSSPEKELKILGDREGVRTIAVRMERHISIFRDLLSLISLIFIFIKEKPHMVHSMTPKAGLLCMLAAWISRVPVRVHTFTGLVWPTSTGISRKILMATDWLTCACSTHVIPEGKGVLDDLHNHITNKSMRILGFGNIRGVDMTIYDGRRADIVARVKNIKNDIFTFIFVGRIVRDKGIDELCDAFSRLSREKQVRLFLVGPFEDNLDPISECARDIIKNNSCIEVLGAKFGDELLSYYAASDCFVFPSYREGFPNTVLEAGAMGLPSIVTDINGSREIIENGKNGVIIPSKNADALYEAMKNMIEDKDAYNTMVTNARPMIESRFEQSFVRKCLLDFYDEIM